MSCTHTQTQTYTHTHSVVHTHTECRILPWTARVCWIMWDMSYQKVCALHNSRQHAAHTQNVTRAHAHECMHTRAHTHTRTHACTHKYTQIHTHTHTHTHIRHPQHAVLETERRVHMQMRRVPMQMRRVHRWGGDHGGLHSVKRDLV